MKRIALYLALVFLLLLSVACTRSATGKPVTPTPQGPAELPFPTPLPPSGGVAATQTAVAVEMLQTLQPEQGGGEPAPEASPTPTPTQPPPQPPTPTPTPEMLPTPTPAHADLTVPSSYTLHQGEYPYCIARRFNIDPDVLLRTNGLTRGQIVYPGTTLVIPQDAPPFPGERAWHPHPDTYIVRYGDTIFSIACYYGDVWPEQIAAANGISLDTPLTPGETLNIP